MSLGKHLMSILVVSFFTFIIALNLIQYGSIYIYTSQHYNSVISVQDTSRFYFGFSDFFNWLGSFPGMTNTINTFSRLADTFVNVGNALFDGFDANDLLSILAFIGNFFTFAFQVIGSVFIDIFTIFQWFFSLIFML